MHNFYDDYILQIILLGHTMSQLRNIDGTQKSSSLVLSLMMISVIQETKTLLLILI